MDKIKDICIESHLKVPRLSQLMLYYLQHKIGALIFEGCGINCVLKWNLCHKTFKKTCTAARTLLSFHSHSLRVRVGQSQT